MRDFKRILSAAKSPEPPKARMIPHELIHHSETTTDPYYWLREKDNPEVIRHLESENVYTDAMMAHTEGFQEKLYEEMVSRIKETDQSVPEKIDSYEYYYKTEKDRQYKLYCRRKLIDNVPGPEEILLDLNGLADGRSYLSMGAYKVSPDHKMLAYSIDLAGSEVYTLYIKDLDTGKLLPDTVANTYYSVEWANDNRTLFYNTIDHAMRPYRVHRHVLGSPQDEMIYEETDERFFLDIAKTRSSKFLLMTSASKLTTEVRYLEANTPSAAFRLFQERTHGVEYSVEHWEDWFFVTTNDNAQNFRLMKTPLGQTERMHWQDVIPHREDTLLRGVDAFRDFLAVYERRDGLKRIGIRDLRSGANHEIEFPEPVYNILFSPNPEYTSPYLRIVYTSLVTPQTVYDYDVAGRKLHLRKQEEIVGYDPANYATERRMAFASDGTEVPMSLVYRRGLQKNGRHPALLYGYGSYGINTDPNFSSSRLSLLDRGFVFAMAHIRGGEEMGRHWYEEGKFLNKKNTFTDFIACAEFLIRENYTSPERLAISGGSAGGLLMGAVINMRPDLFGAVVAHVPFVDVLNTMMDASLPLTVTEYEEWGNPAETEYYDYIRSYSPYDNVAPQSYPAMLITAGLNDPRVSYWEPAKWVAKLREKKTDEHPILLRTHMDFGHSGASGRYDYLKETAFDYAFILDQIGSVHGTFSD